MIKGRAQFFFITAIILLFTRSMNAQSPTAKITDWKNNAKGAYTIIHDDYGDTGVDGIWKYADTICSNRNVKFTFGAIASSCEVNRTVNSYGSPYAYAKNVMIEQHGHEIISHSHTHTCAVGNAGWDPCNLPAGESWGENVNNPEFALQLETAHNSIASNTGHIPVYYIYPYDRFTEIANNRLKTLGYIGSRTGWNSPYAGSGSYYRNGYENNDNSNFYPDANGFFRTAVQVFDDIDRAKNVTGQVAELNGEVDNAIASNKWANRELHNVGDNGWGSVKVESYRKHIDYIKAKEASGDLWIGTVSEILTYQIQKLKYAPTVSYNPTNGTVNVAWQNINAQYGVVISNYLAPLDIKSPVTLHVDLDGLTGTWKVMQNSVEITDVKQVGDQLYINAFPHQGSLTIMKAGSVNNLAPYVANAIPNYSNLLSNFSPITINLYNAFEDVETKDVDLKFTFTGNTDLIVSISNGVATISSPQNWTGSETITFNAEDEKGLRVDETVAITATDIFVGHTPYSGTPIAIPGKVQLENFDEGAEGVVFNEVATTWEPNPINNPYRIGSDVDIANVANVGYVVNYTETGEWLDYTVDVQKSGYYNIAFRVAQLQDQWGTPVGQIKLYIDNQEWMPATAMKYTSSWTSYETVKFPTSLYLTEGGHILRLEFAVGSVDVDYIDITTDLITSTLVEEREDLFYVYPNPSSDQINIFGDFDKVTIVDQYGVVVVEGNEATMDISNLSAGVYFIMKNNGAAVVKFMKAK